MNTGLAVTIDGGPHTFWWPTQSPDGTIQPHQIPPPQIIRELYRDRTQSKKKVSNMRGGLSLWNDLESDSQNEEFLHTPLFLVSLKDPVSRMFSDYYFLEDSLKVNSF